MIKVNGGIFRDQVNTGSLRAFIISGITIADADAASVLLSKVTGAGTASVPEAWILANSPSSAAAADKAYVANVDAGTPVPNTAAELVYRVISTRATVVSIEFTDAGTEMHVIVENAAGWGYDNAAGVAQTLTAALRALDDASGTGLGAYVSAPVTGIADVSDAPALAQFNAALATEVKLTFAGDTDGLTALGGNAHDQS